ncbi:MAG: NAD-dependent epimerase/dehydratase family protein, partial [Syntrophales bacterium]|nr:NAD-dependent epimerase/dehydratase family protein [Syntrophales bacterium]
MKIMVTGALGHIGSKLIRSLPFGIFEEVLLLDNLATNRYPSLFDLPTDIPFRFFPEDILEADLDKRLRGVDAVIHLAALTDAETSFDRAADVEAVNVKGTEKVAMACIRNGCRLF